MQDQPPLEAIMDSIGAFLLEARDQLPPELRFKAIVAANAFGMVGRELETATADAQAEAQRLSALLKADIADAWEARRKAAKAIRNGRFDDHIPATAAVLRESVRAKLAIAHPGWDDFADDGRAAGTPAAEPEPAPEADAEPAGEPEAGAEPAGGPDAES